MNLPTKKAFLALAVLTLGWLFFYERDIPIERAKALLSTPHSSFLQIQGMELHYTDEGVGFPVILIHGTGSMLQTWDAWKEVLLKDFRVIRLDLPGFGLTGPFPDRDYSMDAYTRVLNALTDSLQLDSFYLAGNSLGGQIAWEYAALYPEKVKKMILLAPAGVHVPTKSTLVFKLAKIEWLGSLLQNFGTRFFVRKTLRDVYADPSRIAPEMEKHYLVAAKREGNRRAFMDRLQVSNSDDRIKALSKLNMPVLLQWGDQDVLIPHTVASKFQDLLPNDTLIIYSGVGHVPMEEISDISVRDATNFFINN